MGIGLHCCGLGSKRCLCYQNALVVSTQPREPSPPFMAVTDCRLFSGSVCNSADTATNPPGWAPNSQSTAQEGLLQQELKEWAELLASLDGKDNEDDQLSLAFDTSD